MGPISSPETLDTNYQSKLGKIPGEGRFHLHRVGSLKPRTLLQKILDFWQLLTLQKKRTAFRVCQFKKRSNETCGYTQKNGAISKVNKKFISHLTRAQRTPSAAATVQVSHALPAVRFSCLLRSQFPRWRRSRKRLSVCSVLRCPDL